MTTLNTVMMFVGFALWFWAGYKIGKSKGEREGRSKAIKEVEDAFTAPPKFKL